MNSIRTCRADERAAILAIVNAAAEAYRGVIPADRWHDPYMPAAQLDEEIAAGVTFWGYEQDDTLILLFMCCHSALTPASAISLTLRAVGGLTTAEIAHAFLVPEMTMAQRISRAKQCV